MWKDNGWASIITRGARFVLLTLAACTPSVPQGVPPDGVPDPLLLGRFEDDYGSRYTITADLWTHHPRARYRIVRWRPEAGYLIARNDPDNPGEGGLWTRIDWMPLPGMPPWEWGFCLSAYNAPSAAAAESTRIARRDTPRTGCNGHPFSRMKAVR